MRTSLVMSLILLSAVITPAAAQSAGGPAFNGLRTPVSPAFVLLGIAPTEVERPNTPADLALSVLNRSAAFTSLPRDVALEISPYWLVKHPMLTWEADTVRGLGSSIARTMTISFATAELGTDARPVTGLSLGLRAAPFSGRLSSESIARLKALRDRLTIETSVLADLRAQRLAVLEQTRTQELQAAGSDTTLRREALDRFTAARRELNAIVLQSPEYKAAVDSTEGMFRDLALTRGGFVLELAAGAALHAPGGAADSASLARWGGWITAGYEGKTLSFVVVNRFLASSVDSSFDALDLGMRLIYTSGRYALSAEGSFRSFTERGAPSNEYRVAALVDFELQKGLWVTGTFGRDYAAGAPGSLIAQIGVSLNVAGERVKIPGRVP